jgi:hypothetical protein
VQGVLFLCVNCATDYCLCSECERQRPHDSQHLFLKIYAPLPPDALAQGVLPLLPNLYAPSASTSSTGTQQACPNWIRQRKASDGASRGRAACYNKRTGPRREDQKLACRFVEDITVDDGHAMTPGSPFVKIWRLRNSGNVAWPEGVALSFVSGDSLSLLESIPVMSVAPGAEVDVSVDMTAPKVRSPELLATTRGVHVGAYGDRGVVRAHTFDRCRRWAATCPTGGCKARRASSSDIRCGRTSWW